MIPTIMGTLDPAGEFLRITERYRQMSDSEILILMPQSSQLTPLAQQALASEVRSRGLKVEEDAPTPPGERRPVFYDRHTQTFADSSVRDAPPIKSSSADSGDSDATADLDPEEEDSAYDADRKLVELCTVWSLADARQVQSLLDRAGIPLFMGAEKATNADAVTSNFATGVSVQVMRIGLPWAGQALQNYAPADEPERKQEEPPPELSVQCPKCRSEEIVLEDVVPAAEDSPDKASTYWWSCDSCGYEWEDDGTVKEQ